MKTESILDYDVEFLNLSFETDRKGKGIFTEHILKPMF